MSKPRLAEDKAKLVEQTRQETTVTAIQQVKAKLKEQMEAEAAVREEGKAKINAILSRYLVRIVRFGPKVGQIDPKLDTSGTFSDQPKCTEI